MGRVALCGVIEHAAGAGSNLGGCPVGVSAGVDSGCLVSFSNSLHEARLPAAQSLLDGGRAEYDGRRVVRSLVVPRIRDERCRRCVDSRSGVRGRDCASATAAAARSRARGDPRAALQCAHHPAAWRSWCAGMLWNFEREPFRTLGTEESKTNSYYGLSVEDVRRRAAQQQHAAEDGARRR